MKQEPAGGPLGVVPLWNLRPSERRGCQLGQFLTRLEALAIKRDWPFVRREAYEPALAAAE